MSRITGDYGTSRPNAAAGAAARASRTRARRRLYPLLFEETRFSESPWTDQETGWALGRGLAAIPISVDGETPYGFVGSYQAVKRAAGMSTLDLSRRVFRAICDVVFNSHRPAVPTLADTVAQRVVAAVALANSEEDASLFYELVMKVPARLWTAEYRDRLRETLENNKALFSRTQPENQSATIAQLLKKRIDGERAY